MKILMLLLAIFCSQSLFAKVYYCIEEESIGYDGADNYKVVNFQRRGLLQILTSKIPL